MIEYKEADPQNFIANLRHSIIEKGKKKGLETKCGHGDSEKKWKIYP